MNLTTQVKEAIDFIEQKLGYKPTPTIGLILGSGLGIYANELTQTSEIDFSDIPHFAKASVQGHAGKLIFGKVHGKDVVCMAGRFHFYEGHGIEKTVFPIRVLVKLGIKTLFTTNATGGINETFKAGDFMIITDHINFTCPNPLIGQNEEEFGERFPDMSNIYDTNLVELAQNCAKTLDIPIKKGVMAFYTGPSYETPTEIKAFKLLGADNVGMSTVPETIVAKHSKVACLSISAITNMAVGITQNPLSHEEVLEESKKMLPKFKNLVDEIIKNI